MRSTILVLLLLGATRFLAPEPARADGLELGYYGAGTARLTSVNFQSAMIVGIRAGAILNHGIILGLAANGLVGTVNDTPQTSNLLGMWYAGLHAGYIFPHEKKIAFSATSLFGVGQFQQVGTSTPPDGTSTPPDWLGVIEPEVDLSYEVTPALRIGMGLGYRFVLRANYMSDADAGGPIGGLIVKVGRF